MHVFLTGPVQIGKSTLIAAALDQLQPERLGGFRTISDAPAADGSRSVHLFRASEHPQDHICTSANRVGIRRPGLGIASFPAVFDAVGSEQDPESNSNALNFQMGLWNVIVWPYLPKTIGDKPYFMLMDSRFKEDYLCLPFVERTPLTVKSDIDPNTDANIWRGRARFAAGFNNWRCIALCGEGVSGTSVTA